MYRTFGKRMLDIMLSLIALPFVLLISLFVIPLIWLEDRGPAFYNAPRLGKGGKPFIMYKLRSMHEHAPDIRNQDGTTYNSETDMRVTKMGAFLRKTSIDELPQIFNVLKGEMSFVGPRPDLTDAVETIYRSGDEERLTVLPGITGYSQAYYRNNIKLTERNNHDIVYIRNMSLLLDTKILIKTVLTVVAHRNIFRAGSVEVPDGLDIELQQSKE